MFKYIFNKLIPKTIVKICNFLGICKTPDNCKYQGFCEKFINRKPSCISTYNLDCKEYLYGGWSIRHLDKINNSESKNIDPQLLNCTESFRLLPSKDNKQIIKHQQPVNKSSHKPLHQHSTGIDSTSVLIGSLTTVGTIHAFNKLNNQEDEQKKK